MHFNESGPTHPFSLHVSNSSPFLEQSPLARIENAKTRVLQKVLPRVNHVNVDITIGVENIFIAALVSLSRRQRFCSE